MAETLEVRFSQFCSDTIVSLRNSEPAVTLQLAYAIQSPAVTLQLAYAIQSPAVTLQLVYVIQSLQ